LTFFFLSNIVILAISSYSPQKFTQGGSTMRLSRYLLLLGSCSVLVSIVVVLGQNQKPDTLPKGNWTLKAIPYSGADWSSMPVSVQSVTTNMSNGGTVERVSLANWSKHDVNGIRLRWTLFDGKSQLANGETKSLGTYIASRKMQNIDYPIVSFSQIARLLPKENAEGDFRIEIVVSEIEYSDGNLWKFGDPGIVWEGFSSTLEGGCANQGCVYLAEQGTYFCVSNVTGTYCAVGSQGQSCTVTRCLGEVY
jgi:hypothetical protein